MGSTDTPMGVRSTGSHGRGHLHDSGAGGHRQIDCTIRADGIDNMADDTDS